MLALDAAESKRTPATSSHLGHLVVSRRHALGDGDRTDCASVEHESVPQQADFRVLYAVLEEPPSLFLDDLSAFAYDTALAYDAVVLSDDEYYTFNQYFWRRNGRPVRTEERARLIRLRYESPVLIEIAGVAGAILTVGTTLEWLRNIPRRERLKGIEVRKAEVELERAEVALSKEQREDATVELEISPHTPPLVLPPGQQSVTEREDALHAFVGTVRRMMRSPLRVRQVRTRRANRRELPPA